VGGCYVGRRGVGGRWAEVALPVGGHPLGSVGNRRRLRTRKTIGAEPVGAVTRCPNRTTPMAPDGGPMGVPIRLRGVSRGRL